MKRPLLFFLALCAAVVAFTRSARADVSITLDFFFDALDPYGDWVYVDDYGYCWQPEVAYEDENWSPYSEGSWVWSDGGWTWVSEEDFGWATYHYGRWARVHRHWTWIPGYEWAPAWVSWRTSDDYIGWAPLPPEARWRADVGFSRWTDSYYDIGPAYYNFVSYRSFAEPRLRRHIVDRSQNVTIIDRSVNVTNIVHRENIVNNIFVGGPGLDRVQELGGREIRHFSLRRDDAFDRRLGDRDRRGGDWKHRARIEGSSLFVAAPSIRHDARIHAPSRVRQRFDRETVDHGWRDVADRSAAERLREKFRGEGGDNRPKNLPPKEVRGVLKDAPPEGLRALKKDESDDRPGRRERADGPERANRPDGGNRPDGSGRTNRPDGSNGSNRPDKPKKSERSDQPETPAKGQPDSGRPGRPDRPPGSEQRKRPDRADRPGLPGADRPDRASRPERPASEQQKRPDRPAADPRSGAKPDRSDGPKPSAQPERKEKPQASRRVAPSPQRVAAPRPQPEARQKRAPREPSQPRPQVAQPKPRREAPRPQSLAGPRPTKQPSSKPSAAPPQPQAPGASQADRKKGKKKD